MINLKMHLRNRGKKPRLAAIYTSNSSMAWNSARELSAGASLPVVSSWVVSSHKTIYYAVEQHQNYETEQYVIAALNPVIVIIHNKYPLTVDTAFTGKTCETVYSIIACSAKENRGFFRP